MSIKAILDSIPSEIKDKILSVPQRLSNLGQLYEYKRKQYGDSYLVIGNVLTALFPAGLVLNSTVHFTRFLIMLEMVQKVTRYSTQIHGDGHPDSLNDISVYSQMLAEYDEMMFHSSKGKPVIDINDKQEFLSTIENLKSEIEALRVSNNNLENSNDSHHQRNSELIERVKELEDEVVKAKLKSAAPVRGQKKAS